MKYILLVLYVSFLRRQESLSPFTPTLDDREIPACAGMTRGRRKYVFISVLVTIICCLLLPLQTLAKPLVADISNHEITIHTAFEGTELMLFGARNEPGDIIVVVRGPERKATVRRKEKTWGIWVNRSPETFESIPAFYAMASSRPFEDIMKSIYFKALGIGYDHAINPLRIEQENKIDMTYQKALLRYFREEQLYDRQSGHITFIGDRLFKTNIPFPDNMPRGTYTAEVYLFSDGELIGTQTSPISVYKSGFDAFVYETAHEHPYVYGFIAIILAIGAGWMASTASGRIGG